VWGVFGVWLIRGIGSAAVCVARAGGGCTGGAGAMLVEG
jgi:hypothetical protein